jgi:hypothetical protein
VLGDCDRAEWHEEVLRRALHLLCRYGADSAEYLAHVAEAKEREERRAA